MATAATRIAGLVMGWVVGGMLAAGAAEDPAAPEGVGGGVDGLMPKMEIGALRFLDRHPEHDGRGVVIAILDTGVDPGAAGLQTTPDGRPKIVDLIDATGDGDVDTSTVVEVKDGVITGLSGRVLRPGVGWVNPTGKYRLGLKGGYALFPRPLVGRLRAERRERWLEGQRPMEARLQTAVAEAKARQAQPTPEQERELKELEARLEQARDLDGGYEDPGPVFDCVVFHDGAVWRAVVDVDEDGDLAEESVLTDYRVERRHGSFGKEAALNFAVNILDEGKRLSLVTDSGSHGTHVAGIAAGYFPGQTDLNGIAPGAQVVSVKIGDVRLDTMETASALIRAMNVVRALRCDIVSMSYGEYSILPDRGRVIEAMTGLVDETGVVFVAAAGNNGPALSTLGSPGGTTSALIGVGAYLSPAMMERANSALDILSETQYVFSSRGPTLDGDWGVSVSAPGGAVAPVPNWTLNRHRLMAGTSMATPSVSGAVALMVSGLKAGKLAYSPASIRRALENSARVIPGTDIFGQGHGLVQVDAAFELCRKMAEAGAIRPRIRVRVGRETGSARGVYLREPAESGRVLETRVDLAPVYAKATANAERFRFEARYRLETAVPWVRSGRFCLVAHDGGGFGLEVDPTGLVPGVHTAEVLGYEEGHEDLGPAFRVPITVIRPMPVVPGERVGWSETVTLERGSRIERRFVAVPPTATWAELRLRSAGDVEDGSCEVKTSQLLPGRLPGEGGVGHRFRWSGSGGAEEISRFPVEAGRTLELAIGPASAPGTGVMPVELSLVFRGVQPGTREVHFDGAGRVLRVAVRAAESPARLSPRATLTARHRAVGPSGAEVRVVSDVRDRLPGGRTTYELVLSYPVSMDDGGTVTPRFPGLNGRLYDGQFESQLWMVLDAARRVVAVDDGWEPGSVRLGKGEHTLRFHLRHERLEWLEGLKTLPLVLEQALGEVVTLPVYAGADDALLGRGPFGGTDLVPGESSVFFLGTPSAASMSRAGRPGDLLVGRIRHEADPCPVGYALTFRVPPAEAAGGGGGKVSGSDREERSLEVRLADERRDFEIGQLAKMGGETNAPLFEARFTELASRHPGHLPLRVARLHRWDGAGRTEAVLRQVVEAADEVIRGVDTAGLAARLGRRVGEEDAVGRTNRVDMERQRGVLVDALQRKAMALARMARMAGTGGVDADTDTAASKDRGGSGGGEASVEAFEAVMRELETWVDVGGEGYAELRAIREEGRGRLGEALRITRGRVRAKPTDASLWREEIRLLRRLGWEAWADHEERWMRVRFPKGDPMF